MRRLLLVSLVVLVASACHHPAAATPVVRLFGPVIDNETIAGRANDSTDDDPVLMLIGERDLVALDLKQRTFSRRSLSLATASSCWGLARLEDGSLWTVCDWRRLRQVDVTGATLAEYELDGAQAALFSAGDRLLFQRAQFTAPDQALVAGRPGDASREAWGTLQTRAFKLARTSVAALNLVSCGNTRSAERACWFPDDAAVAMIDQAGRTRRVELGGIPQVAPEVFLTSENPARPVRDAFVDKYGSLWVISAGTPAGNGPNYPGGWLLAHFDGAGVPLARFQLAEPARLILRADTRRVMLLLGSGYVAEVML
jgi:hypothetical protein